MPITAIDKSTDDLTLTITADFPVPLRRLWDAYADPRQLERFWGPVGCPATFTRHDLTTGGRSHFFMTLPDGSVSRGYWEFVALDPLQSFEVRDGFAREDGVPDPDRPSMRMVFSFTETDSGSRLTTTTFFHSADELEQLLEMGMLEGTESAMGQIDDVLADLASFAAGRGTEVQILDDTRVRVSRVIRGSVDQVWRAHHDSALMRRWMLGPDGWTMPVCDPAQKVGDAFRYEWETVDGKDRFGFTGEVLESVPPVHEASTESMIGVDGPGTTNEMTLTAVDGGTLLVTIITYPSPGMRDTVLGTGMVDGMEASYARMEAEVLTRA